MSASMTIFNSELMLSDLNGNPWFLQDYINVFQINKDDENKINTLLSQYSCNRFLGSLILYIRLHFTEIMMEVKCKVSPPHISKVDYCYVNLSDFLMKVKKSDPHVFLYFLQGFGLDPSIYPTEYEDVFFLRFSKNYLELGFNEELCSIAKKDDVRVFLDFQCIEKLMNEIRNCKIYIENKDNERRENHERKIVRNYCEISLLREKAFNQWKMKFNK